MSSFMIFALVLTIAYVLYYAVVVAKDLQGKKGIANSNEEVFDWTAWKKRSPWK